MTEDLFNEVFSEHGEVVKVDIVKDKATGRGKGFAFVTFKDPDSVDKCNSKCHSNSTTYEGKSKVSGLIYFKLLRTGPLSSSKEESH